MKRVLTVFGTRPEAYKMIPLVLALQTRHDVLESRVCVTAQHRELLDNALTPFGIVPDVDLNIMTQGQTQGDVVSRVLAGMAPALTDWRPDIVLVHGDTTTTFAAALAAFHAKVAVGHVEAGLRTFDKYRPYPEEMHRKLTTALADFHFAPTVLSQQYLLDEKVPAERIFVTGNTALDMLRYTASDDYKFNNADAARVCAEAAEGKNPLILLTAHRRENIGQPMEAICRAAGRIAADFPHARILWPMHPNGAGRAASQQHLAHLPNVVLTQALDLHDIHNVMRRAHLILTDSGGIQEEAPSFNVPVVVLREVTERPEGVDAGALVLGGVHEAGIYDATARLLTDTAAHAKMAAVPNPYGDGKASERIVQAIIENLK